MGKIIRSVCVHLPPLFSPPLPLPRLPFRRPRACGRDVLRPDSRRREFSFFSWSAFCVPFVAESPSSRSPLRRGVVRRSPLRRVLLLGQRPLRRGVVRRRGTLCGGVRSPWLCAAPGVRSPAGPQENVVRICRRAEARGQVGFPTLNSPTFMPAPTGNEKDSKKSKDGFVLSKSSADMRHFSKGVESLRQEKEACKF